MWLKHTQLDLCGAQRQGLVDSAGQRVFITFQPNHSVLLRASRLLTKALNTPSCPAASALPGISWLSTSLAPPNWTTPGTACALRGITRLTGPGWIALGRECLQAAWQIKEESSWPDWRRTGFFSRALLLVWFSEMPWITLSFSPHKGRNTG